MIHFDFVMDDIDAENLMAIVSKEVGSLYVLIVKEMAGENRYSMIKAYQDHIKDTNRLISLMKNSRVKE
tara:strand:- start:1863 stop:2069 length:207 start_codon:yes stop_codon:yes gene_type:complete